MEIIDSLELDQAIELEVTLIRLGSGEEAVVFEDCTGEIPYIYKESFFRAAKWLASKVDHESRRALMEAERIAAVDEYIKARPQLDSLHNRRIFEAGFERAWSHLTS